MIFVFFWFTAQLIYTPNELPTEEAPLQDWTFHQTHAQSKPVLAPTYLSNKDLQAFTIKRIRPFPRIKEPRTWDGHLSAQNFKTPQEKAELKNMEATLHQVMDRFLVDHVQPLKTLEIKNEKNKSRGMANGRKMILHTGTIETKQIGRAHV